MGKLVMDRRAADNKYLHRDFHAAFDQGIEYLGMQFGDNAVREYLYKFGKEYYAPLIEEIKKDGLAALKRHIEKTYETEELPDALECKLSDNELLVNIRECPAVQYMKSVGRTPSKWYKLSTSTVNEAIADGADLGFEMIDYDEKDGRASYRFFRR